MKLVSKPEPGYCSTTIFEWSEFFVWHSHQRYSLINIRTKNDSFSEWVEGDWPANFDNVIKSKNDVYKIISSLGLMEKFIDCITNETRESGFEDGQDDIRAKFRSLINI